MSKKVLTLDWDDSKEYKFLSKEIMIPFISLVLMAMGPQLALTLEGSLTPYMMADLNAAKFNSVQNIIGQIFRACSALAWGGLFERFNKKNIIVSLCLFSLAANVVRMLAVNVWMVVLGAIITSIGAGGANAGLIALTAYMLPTKFRGRFYSVRSFVAVILTMMSPLASWVVLNWGWRYNFAMSSVAYIIVLVAILLTAPSMPAPGNVIKKKYDYVGVLIFLMGTILIFSASFLGGDVLPWSSPIIYILIIAGLVVYYIGIQYEKKHDDIALMSISLLKNRYFVSAMMLSVLYFAAFSIKSYEQIYCVQGFGMVLTTFTAIKVIPTMLGHGLGVAFPIVMEKTGAVKTISGVFVGANIISMFMFYFMSAATPTYVFLSLTANTFIALSLGQLLVANSVERKDISKAAGTYTFVYYFTQALFSLINNILLNNVHVSSLKPLAEKAGILSKLSPSQLQTMSTYSILSSPKTLSAFKATFGANVDTYEKAVKVVQECVVAACRWMFLVAAIFCIIAFFFIFGLKKDIKIVAKKAAKG